jgi:hypothetical protein
VIFNICILPNFVTLLNNLLPTNAHSLLFSYVTYILSDVSIRTDHRLGLLYMNISRIPHHTYNLLKSSIFKNVFKICREFRMLCPSYKLEYNISDIWKQNKACAFVGNKIIKINALIKNFMLAWQSQCDTTTTQLRAAGWTSKTRGLKLHHIPD